MSDILNWLMEGYRLMLETGMDAPPRVTAAVDAYRQEADIFGSFLFDDTIETEGNRLLTSDLYIYYTAWAKDNDYRPMNNKNFVGELRRRYEVRRDGAKGNVVVGIALNFDPNPFND